MHALMFAHNADEAAVLKVILQQVGFRVRRGRDIEHAVDTWPDHPAELILIAFPEETPDKNITIKQIRAYTPVPIVLISDPLPETRFAAYLDAGADLVILRPFGTRSLIAQLRALLRRSVGVQVAGLPLIIRGDITLDPSRRVVRVNSQEPHRLTRLEFRLLYTLMTHIDQVLPAEVIVEQVWGYSGEGNRDLVRGLVQRLRLKIEENPRNPHRILTEPGVGYYLNVQETTE